MNLISRSLEAISLVLLGLFSAVLNRNRPIWLLSHDNTKPSMLDASSITLGLFGGLASLSGMLIAAFLITSQISGQQPYSRFTKSIRGRADIIPFASLMIALLFCLASPTLIAGKLISGQVAVEAAIFATSAAVMAAFCLLQRNTEIFDVQRVADKLLADFTHKNVSIYGLAEINLSPSTINPEIKLRHWGHRHNLEDPLGAYHDLLMESINKRERITMHKILSRLIYRLADLNDAFLVRKFAIARGPESPRSKILKSLMSLAIRLRIKSKEDLKVASTFHGLHYLIRRGRALAKEWGLDNHRQIFIINIGDLAHAIESSGGNDLCTKLCFHGILSICQAYSDINEFGSYEPIHELVNVAADLRIRGKRNLSEECLRVIAWLDLNSRYVSRSSLSEYNIIAESIDATTLERLEWWKIKYQGLAFSEAFPDSIWQY
jgi:hypothetical protein